ncbi:hypothetical protein N9980_00560 [bacterium]|nr:hypothetical protein [bacterium]
MIKTIIESPYAGDTEKNVAYARECMRDSLLRGEAPYASHLLYTQAGILDDLIPSERDMGIQAGFAWKHTAGVVSVFYKDLGMSEGMQQAFDYCVEYNLPYSVRFVRS